MRFPLANHRREGLVDHAVRQQDGGQQGQVLRLHRILEGDAGGGDEDGLRLLPPGGAEAVEHRPRRQIGVGLSDACSGVAQGDGAVQQGVQHQMAEMRLLGALCHALGRKQVVKNMVDHFMGFFPVIFGVHPNSPLKAAPHFGVEPPGFISSSFSPHSHSHPGEVGNSTGRVWHDPRGRVPGVSADFNPRWSPAAWFTGRSKASHCKPGQRQCWKSCQRPPHQVAFSLTGGGSSPLRVVARAGGRSSVRAVTRTAGVNFSKYEAFRLYFDCSRAQFVFLEWISHNSVTNSHKLSQFFLKCY